MSHANLWHTAYFAAVCETDDSSMPGRILEALACIEQRLLSPIDSEEYRAIKNAQAALESLKAVRIPSNGLGVRSTAPPSRSTPLA
jgi:hypothetical protein